MGLIKCPECEKDVSDQAESCPNCGCPMQKTQQNNVNRGVNVYGTWEQTQNKKPKQKSHGCLIAFLVMILVILLFLALVGVGGCIVEKKVKDTFGDQNSVSNESEADVESETTEQSIVDESENAKVYNVGETASLKDWAIVVTDFKIVDSIDDDYGYFSPDSEQGKYAQLFLTVANNGKQAMTFLPYYGMGDDVEVKLLYGDNYEFSATNLMGYSNEMHEAGINPLSSQSGEIAFEIPDSVASSTDEILIQFSSGNDKIQFKVR